MKENIFCISLVVIVSVLILLNINISFQYSTAENILITIK